jgi:hypothetical protein
MSVSIFSRMNNYSWMMTKTFTEYKRHEPTQSLLYQVLDQNIQEFFDTVAQDPDHKALPDFIVHEFDKFLKCGVLSEGFVRLKCDECTHSIIVPFSCKCRGFCPSCARPIQFSRFS